MPLGALADQLDILPDQCIMPLEPLSMLVVALISSVSSILQSSDPSLNPGDHWIAAVHLSEGDAS